MGKKVSSIVSVALNPLLMPLILFVIIYFYAPFVLAPFNNYAFLLMIFISTFFIPLIILIALYKSGFVPSFLMDEQSDRAIPFTFTAIFYWGLTYLFFTQYKTNLTVLVLIMSISTTISIVAITNYFWKISAHSAGIVGVVGFLSALSNKYPEVNFLYPSLIVLILAGLTMSARLNLQIHNPAQIAAGALLGFVNSFLFVLFLL